MRQMVFGSRKRKVFSISTLVLLLSSTAALAAFLLYQGTSGGGSGTFATSSTVSAITLTVQPPVALGPGDTSAILQIDALNNDPSAAHAIQTLTETFTSVPASCASFLTLNNKASIIASTQDDFGAATWIPAGVSRDLDANTIAPSTATISLGAATPAVCASGTWSLSFTGSTLG